MKRTIKQAIKAAGLNADTFCITRDDFTTSSQQDATAVVVQLREMGVSIALETATRSAWDGPKDTFGAIIGAAYVSAY